MHTNRCPWCAKRIDRKCNRYQKPRTTLGSRYTRFERCQYCKHFYGQRLDVKWVFLYIAVALAGIIALGIVWYQMAYLAVFPLAVVTVLWICLRPLQRMDEEENPIPSDSPLLKATVDPNGRKIEKNALYFLSDDFDTQDSFTAVSPIRIHTINRKTGELSFSFLYEHPLNREYIGHEKIALYDSEMLLTAEMTNVRESMG